MFIEILLMVIGQIAASLSIFLIRSSQLAAGYLAAYRLFLTAFLLMPLCIRDAKKVKSTLPEHSHWGNVLSHLIRHSLFPGFMLGVHFVFWNNAATMTLAANASLLVNMVPLFMPILSFFMTSERPNKQGLIATLIAIGGVILLTVGDISLGGNHLRGDLYAIISMLFLAVYLALSRKHKALPFWYYISAVYFFGAITAFIASFIQGEALWSDRGLVDLLPVIGLTLGPTFLGHNLINRAMRRIPSQLVSIGQLSQVLWAGILAWIIYDEVPQAVFYPAVGLIGLGMAIVIHAHHTKQKENNNANRLSRS